MKLFVVICLVLAGVSQGDVSSGGAAVHDLTTENFEHLTQAATGATTGDWFVKFYAPWCGHCKNMAPDWEKLAKELHGEINVAKVDGTKSKLLNKRFGIKSYPTLIYFHHGKLYRYKGPRKVELLAKFAQDILHEGVFPENVVEEDVPGEISPSDVSLDGLSGFIESLSLPELLLIAILVSGSGAGLLVYLTSGGSTKKTDKKKQ